MSEVAADVKLALALNEACKSLEGDRLRSFVRAAAAFATYADDRGAPVEIRSLLMELLAELCNLAEGRESIVLRPAARGGRPLKANQYEALYAYASVYVDCHDGSLEACIEAEQRITAAGLPLPTRSRFVGCSGNAIRNWRGQRNSMRNTDTIERHFLAARSIIEQQKKQGLSEREAADRILNAAILLGVS